MMPFQRSTLVTVRPLANYSTFKYPGLLCVHNWNNNNKYSSVSQSRTRELDETGHSSQLEMTPEKIPETTQLVSLVQKTAAPNIPPGILNYFHSEGQTENVSLRQQSSGTNGQENTVNANSRQDTPSTLNKLASLSEELPSYSKFTLGLSPPMFPSLLFPQQVTYEKPEKPTNFKQSLQYWNTKNDPPTSTQPSTSTSNKFKYSAPFGGNVDFITPPLDERGSRFLARHGRELAPSPGTPTQPAADPLNLHRYEQKSQFKVAHPYVKHQRDTQAATPGRAKPEAAYLSDSYSPNRDLSPPTMPTTQPSSFKGGSHCSPEAAPESIYSIDDISESGSPGSASDEESPTSRYRGACGIKPPCFKLSAEFGDETKGFERAQTITDKEFYHFINQKNLASIMFHYGPKTTKDTLGVWDREAKEESVSGDRAYGIVNCANELHLCVREGIPTCPFYKTYSEGYPVYAGTQFKLWN